MPGLISLFLLGASSGLPAGLNLELPALSLPTLAEEPDFRPNAPAWGTREEQRDAPPRWLRLATAGVLEPVAGTLAAGVGLAFSVTPVILLLSIGPQVAPGGGAWVVPAFILAAIPILVGPGLAAGATVFAVSEWVAGVHASPWASLGGGVAGNLAAIALASIWKADPRLLLLFPTGGAMLGCNLSAAFMEQGPSATVPLYDEPPGTWLPLASGQF